MPSKGFITGIVANAPRGIRYATMAVHASSVVYSGKLCPQRQLVHSWMLDSKILKSCAPFNSSEQPRNEKMSNFGGPSESNEDTKNQTDDPPVDSNDESKKESNIIPPERPLTPIQQHPKSRKKIEKKKHNEEHRNITKIPILTTDSAIGAGAGAPGGSNKGDNKDAIFITPPEINDRGSFPPLLAIPMKDRPPLPGKSFSIYVTDPEVINCFNKMSVSRDGYFLLFHVSDINAPDTDVINSPESVRKVGVLCQLMRHTIGMSKISVLAFPHHRVLLDELVPPSVNASMDKVPSQVCFHGSRVSTAITEPYPTEPFDKDSVQIKALTTAMKDIMDSVGKHNPLSASIIRSISENLSSPGQLADLVGAVVHSTPDRIQEILEANSVEKRLSIALELLKVEQAASTVKDEVINLLASKVDEQYVTSFLKTYIKELQKRVGGPDANEQKSNKFDERIKHLKLSEEALEAYKTERSKLESLTEHVSEQGISEKYLDWLTSIPWGVYSKDRFDIKEARNVLDHDHYGLKDVKDRILEFISVGKVSGNLEGKILCFVGPPGTGKTSIAKAIADSLNRQYVRIAMGGVKDVHEVKGHRRTYLGSVPGRVIYALKQAKTMNPLILIDEIDKLDLTSSGGASSAFLEILDPEQNSGFVDNYIDVRVDLSKVLFVCTANHLDTIPGPLRDRMEVIEVSGYTNSEKNKIATNHLIPNAAKKAGLDISKVSVSPDAINRLIEKYCRESGLRNVKRLITRIFSKAAMKIVEEIESRELNPGHDSSQKSSPIAGADAREDASPVEALSADRSKSQVDIVKVASSERSTAQVNEDAKPVDELAEGGTTALVIPNDVNLQVTPENLKDYIGPEVYIRNRVYDSPPIGVATGLAYTTAGGEALYIELIPVNRIQSNHGTPGVRVTGSLKDVMKESSSIAYSFAKLYMNLNFPENRFFEAAEIHLHCPDGATPKDGPSAGVAFTSSLLSLALNEPIPANIAMTGEITVTGRVLAVGGLKEKILGAKRFGYDMIIFPKDIENTLEEISDEVKEGVKLLPVTTFQQVFDLIFSGLDHERASTVWKAEFAALDKIKSNVGAKS